MNILRKTFPKREQNEQIEVKEKNGVTYLSFPNIENTGIAKHYIATRLGGVSEGEFSAMNLSFTRGDEKAAVEENYKRFAAVMDCCVDDMVLTFQTHTTNVRTVTAKDRGKGITQKRDYKDVDGLITNEPGIVLAAFFADCVPLLFVDPIHKAIGVSHSGWRGTVAEMGRVTLEKMAQEYETKAEDVIVAIGPSICKDCYEVGADVAEPFMEKFGQSVVEKKNNEKYQLDLWKANQMVLEKAGIKAKNLQITDICTCCNPELLFSHRASHGKRGNLAAFISIKKGI